MIGPGGVGWFGPDHHVELNLGCYVMASGKTLSSSLMGSWGSCRDHSEIGLLKGGIKSNA